MRYDTGCGVIGRGPSAVATDRACAATSAWPALAAGDLAAKRIPFVVEPLELGAERHIEPLVHPPACVLPAQHRYLHQGQGGRARPALRRATTTSWPRRRRRRMRTSVRRAAPTRTAGRAPTRPRTTSRGTGGRRRTARRRPSRRPTASASRPSRPACRSGSRAAATWTRRSSCAGGRAAAPAGYRIVGVLEGDRVVAVAGFRVLHNLAWGDALYVDDLSTLPEARGRGHGAALLEWCADEATEAGGRWRLAPRIRGLDRSVRTPTGSTSTSASGYRAITSCARCSGSSRLGRLRPTPCSLWASVLHSGNSSTHAPLRAPSAGWCSAGSVRPGGRCRCSTRGIRRSTRRCGPVPGCSTCRTWARSRPAGRRRRRCCSGCFRTT